MFKIFRKKENTKRNAGYAVRYFPYGESKTRFCESFVEASALYNDYFERGWNPRITHLWDPKLQKERVY